MKIKKIVTKSELEAREKKLRTWMAVFIVVIMAASTAGFAINFASNENEVKYNDIKFTATQYGWQPEGYDFYTSYLPQDVENFTFDGSFSYSDFSSKVYLISPPYLQNSLMELLRALPMQNLQFACLEEDKNLTYCDNVPIRSCMDANSEAGVIIVKESNESSISYNNYCLEIQGEEQDMQALSDRALFEAYDIIV